MEPNTTLLSTLQVGDTVICECSSILTRREVSEVTDVICVEKCSLRFSKTDGFARNKARNKKEVIYKAWRIYPLTPEIDAWMRHKELATKTTFYMQIASSSLENLSDEQLLQILEILDPLVSSDARKRSGWE